VVGGETPARAMLNNGGLRGEVWSSCWADGGGRRAVVLLAFQAALQTVCAAQLHILCGNVNGAAALPS